MLSRVNETMFDLLRMAFMPPVSSFVLKQKLSDEEWNCLHDEAVKQLLVGILYRAIQKLPLEMRPPMDLIFQWASEAETVKGQNARLNGVAASLTQMFAERGYKTAILKGAANARLYPDPCMRQVGDIDLWVDGEREGLIALVESMGFVIDKKSLRSAYHFHFENKVRGILVEIHYKPSSGCYSPFVRKRIWNFLENEIQKQELAPEGFYVPTIKFALVMQLAHIQKHLLDAGIGFKQIVDYFVLLQNASEADRVDVAEILKKFRLGKTAAALMWVLERIIGLEKSKMICDPDERLGKKMLEDVILSGNFGFSKTWYGENFIWRWLKKKFRFFETFCFAPSEVMWHELDYWKFFLKSIPMRIRLGKISVWDEFHDKRRYEKKNP